MISNRWAILFLLFFARTTMGLQFQSIAAVGPVMVPALNLDCALLGTLIGLFMIPGIFVAIPGGALGQKFGEKVLVLVGLLAMALGSFAINFSEALSVISAGRLLTGAGAVLLNIMVTKMTADWFADKGLNTAMGLLVTSWPIGIGLALIVLGPSAAAFGWPEALQITGWVSLVAFVAILVGYQTPPHYVAMARQPLLSGIPRRDLAIASTAGIAWTLYNVGFIIVVSFTPTLLTETGHSSGTASFVTSIASWAGLPATILGGILADRTGRGVTIILISMIVMAATVPFIISSGSPALMVLVVGIAAGLPAGALMALPARSLSVEGRAIGMGVFFTWYYIGMSTLPAVAGWSRDATGYISAPLWFASAIVILAIVFVGLYQQAGGARR